MKNLTCTIIILFTFQTISFSQVWQAHDAGFSDTLDGGWTYIVDENMAWTYAASSDEFGFNDFGKTGISRTFDGGQTWHATNPPTLDSGVILNMSVQNAERAWVSFITPGYYSRIYYTFDGGNNWIQVPIPFTSLVRFVHMWNVLEGIIVCSADDNGMVIFRTINGGLSWNRLQNLPDVPEYEGLWSDCYKAIGDELWFMTWTGMIFHTDDKGATWTSWDSPFTGFGSALLEVSEQKDVYAIFYRYIQIADRGVVNIYRRNVKENDWTEVTESNNNFYMYDLISIPGSGALMSTINDWHDVGPVTRVSYDRGETWNEVETLTPAKNLAFYSSSHGYATQQRGFVENPTQTNIYTYIGSPLTGLLQPKPMPGEPFSLSPVITSDVTRFEFHSSSMNDYWLNVNDQSGKLVYHKKFNGVNSVEETIDVSRLPIGSYTVTLASNHGLQTHKLIRIN